MHPCAGNIVMGSPRLLGVKLSEQPGLSLGLSFDVRIADVECPSQSWYTLMAFTASCRPASWHAHARAWRRSQQ